MQKITGKWSAFALALWMGWGSLATAGVLYRFVDKNGVVHFTNSPVDPRYEIVRQKYFRDRQEVISLTARSRGRRNYDKLIARLANQYDLAPSLVKAVIAAESNFQAEAVSHKGAQGLMQLMPATAQTLGVENPFDPVQNVDGGVRYLRSLMDRFGNLSYALAAYNAGPEAVNRHGGIPPYPETREYVKRVMTYYRKYHGDFTP